MESNFRDLKKALEEANNMVDHPKHYQGSNFEVIDIINDYKLNFELGNAIKYILRAEKKGNKKQDLEKAIWYLRYELSKLEK
jgi:hypothetical protein